MSDNENEAQVYNAGHQVEGLDRCNTIMVMLEQLLRDHPAIVRVDGDGLIEQAFGAIWTLYQRIGQIDDGLIDDRTPAYIALSNENDRLLAIISQREGKS